MDFVRIGNKIINRLRIQRMIEKIIQMRSKGLSQTEVAGRLGLDRTFISRLEGLGEVRWGEKIALIGFPVKNKAEIMDLALAQGIEYVFLLTEEERWEFLDKRSGVDLFNSIMDMISHLKEFDTIIFLGSDKRIDLLESLLEGKLISIKIGTSPITEDKMVDTWALKGIIETLKEGE